MRSTGGPETSVTNSQFTLHNIPEQRQSHFHCGGKLKSHIMVVSLLGNFVTILGAFAKLRKATVGFGMSVHLSFRLPVSPHGTTRLPMDLF